MIPLASVVLAYSAGELDVAKMSWAFPLEVGEAVEEGEQMSSAVIAVETEVVVFLHQEAAEVVVVVVEGWNEAVIAVEPEVAVPLHQKAAEVEVEDCYEAVIAVETEAVVPLHQEVAEVEDCYEAAVAAVVLLELRRLEMMRQESKNRTRVVCTLLRLRLRCCRSSGDDSSSTDRPFAFFPEPKRRTQRRI